MVTGPDSLLDQIALGAVERDYREGVSSAEQVRAACDLPSRLFLGRLEDTSFSWDEDGWRAQYQGEAMAVELSWDRKHSRLSAVQQWYGRTAITEIGDGSFAKLVQAGFAHLEWLRDLHNALTPRLNVWVETGGDDQPMVSCYPDGLPLTLVLPVALEHLHLCPVLLKRLHADPTLLASVAAELQRGWSVVNYIEGASPHLDYPPLTMDYYLLRVFGLPTLQASQVQVRGDGVRALTVRRQHYQLVIRVFFCDLIRVLHALADLGLVAPKPEPGESYAEQYPDAPEYSVVVLPAVLGRLLKQAVFFDDARTRRTVYPGPISIVNVPAPSLKQAANSAARKIGDLQAMLRALLAELDGEAEQ